MKNVIGLMFLASLSVPVMASSLVCAKNSKGLELKVTNLQADEMLLSAQDNKVQVSLLGDKNIELNNRVFQQETSGGSESGWGSAGFTSTVGTSGASLEITKFGDEGILVQLDLSRGKLYDVLYFMNCTLKN